MNILYVRSDKYSAAKISFLQLKVRIASLHTNTADTMMDNNSNGDGGNMFNPSSPIDMKPDSTHLLAMANSHSGGGDNYGNGGQNQQQYPQNHPLSGAKHMCSICGDRASGKHYGVYSCEGCKGFFKRTVRKELTYQCREDRNCIVDKRQRNRCQYCRYMKCLSMGMRREAVQEERGVPNAKGGKEEGGEEMNSYVNEMPHTQVLEAERACDKFQEGLSAENAGDDLASKFKFAADLQLQALVEWAKQIPHFLEFRPEDQVALLRNGWNELMISGVSFRSIGVKDGLMLANGVLVTRETAHEAGMGNVFDRILIELVRKMTDLRMDKTELGFLRCIVLYNSDTKGLSDTSKVESFRERVYASLEDYVRTNHPTETGRFAKLLLRLPALRSIGLKCDEHLLFFNIINSDSQTSDMDSHMANFENHLRNLLEVNAE